MEKITGEQIAEIGDKILDVATIFDPADAAAIKALLEAGTQLNNMIQKIKNQSDANRQAVWDDVRTNYSDAVAAFEESAASHAS